MTGLFTRAASNRPASKIILLGALRRHLLAVHLVDRPKTGMRIDHFGGRLD
jgi:hypothetical protein